jgi:hypothetical protein
LRPFAFLPSFGVNFGMETIFPTLQAFFRSIGLPLTQDTELTVLSGKHGLDSAQSRVANGIGIMNAQRLSDGTNYRAFIQRHRSNGHRFKVN